MKISNLREKTQLLDAIILCLLCSKLAFESYADIIGTLLFWVHQKSSVSTFWSIKPKKDHL